VHKFVAQISKLEKFQAGSLGYNASLINQNRKSGRTNLNKHTEEWLKQADYDMGVAEFLFKGAKYSYTVFMCHLSIEKALKGLYIQILNEEPPKIHNLIYFVEKLKLNPPDDLLNFLVILNRMNIATRYPDELEKMLKEYDKDRTKKLLIKSKETLEWIKTQLQMPSDS